MSITEIFMLRRINLGDGRISLEQIPPVIFPTGARLSFSTVSVVKCGKVGKTSSFLNSTGANLLTWVGELSAALTVSGKGGLDTGSEGASTWYAVHLIGDTTGVNATDVLLSLSETAPTLPSGYNVFRRVGWIRNDSSSNIQEWFQYGKGRERRYWWKINKNSLKALNDGNATSWTAVSLAAFVPPSVQDVTLLLEFKTGSAGAKNDRCRLRPTGSGELNMPFTFQPGHISIRKSFIQMEMPCNENQSVGYRVEDGGVDKNELNIVVAGFIDEI